MTAAITPAPSSTPPGTARVRSVSLPGPAGRLEALLNEGAPAAPFAALVCHPHPHGGGSMHNTVVYHVMKTLNEPQWGLGWPVLRFNFRGTGLSQGTHDGKAETDDVLAALDWLENEYNRPLVAVGFSFGAAMALNACCGRGNIRALVALGLPTSAQGCEYRYPCLKNCTMPKLFLSGANDRYAPAAQLAQVAASTPQPTKLVLLPRADHFFTGQLEALQGTLAGWLKEQLR